MTEPEQSTGDTGPDDDRPTIAPFLGALAIFGAIVIAIVVLNGNSDDGPTPEQDVGRAAVAQNDALQRADYADYQRYTCAALDGQEGDVLARQRDSVAQRGERYVDDIDDVRIAGDEARGFVTYHFDNAPEATERVELTFVREAGAWTVCSPGPS
jgi:hypothetical protein